MCLIYDAIKKTSEITSSNKLILWVCNKKITGTFYDCEQGGCSEGVITLKDVVVEKCDKAFECEFSELKWLNIIATSIRAYSFKCCEK